MYMLQSKYKSICFYANYSRKCLACDWSHAT